jgi:ferritin-like metal-binding protein YciE
MKIEKTIIADRGAGEPISLGAALIAGKKVAPDAINLLVMDHLEARGFFEWYERAATASEKVRVAGKLRLALGVHMQVEEEIFYPAAGEATGDEAMVRHAVEEHDEAKQLIARLEAGGPVDETYDATVRQLRQVIEHHVTEEETSFFPKVRTTDLDLYQLGRRVAARRLELLFERSGMNPKETQMDLSNATDVGARANPSRETDLTPVSHDEARKLFIEGLRNAHASEENCRTMMQRQIERLENYPRVEARLRTHLRETEAQIERLESILEGLGESRSALKDMAMKVGANMGAMMNAPAGDEILKNSLANYAMANFEIAAYESLLVIGEAAGETEAVRTLQKSLSEERAMAAWLAENLRGLTVMHLQLRSEGATAKH